MGDKVGFVVGGLVPVGEKDGRLVGKTGNVEEENSENMVSSQFDPLHPNIHESQFPVIGLIVPWPLHKGVLSRMRDRNASE